MLGGLPFSVPPLELRYVVLAVSLDPLPHADFWSRIATSIGRKFGTTVFLVSKSLELPNLATRDSLYEANEAAVAGEPAMAASPFF